MFQLFKSKKINNPKEEFKKKFFSNPHHQWISADKTLLRLIGILVDSLPAEFCQFINKSNGLMLLPCQGEMSSALSGLSNTHIVLVFPDLEKMLYSAAWSQAIAILAHEFGHLYYRHSEREISTLEAQKEADQFAYLIGFGSELFNVLLDHKDFPYARDRIENLNKLMTNDKI